MIDRATPITLPMKDRKNVSTLIYKRKRFYGLAVISFLFILKNNSLLGIHFAPLNDNKIKSIIF